MAKPPATPPNSDLDGVHRDGMRPSKPLPTEDDAADLEKARRGNAARPDYDGEGSRDDRTG